MTHQKIEEIAPAKINLYLEVTGRRPNGYHDLDSLVIFADVGERLIVEQADDLSLKIEGPWAGALDGEADNLILKAARLLQNRLGVTQGARFTLVKHIPVAAGVGGGSADAAAALRALNRLWRLNLSEEVLCEIGLELGADVPVCVRSRTSRFLGIGDEVSDGPVLPEDMGLILINPRVAVSTKDVFSRVELVVSTTGEYPDRFESFEDLKQWLSSRRNDLEGPAKSLAQEISASLAGLNSHVPDAFVAMSGSGATCLALCASVELASTLVESLGRNFPSWWIWSGKISL